MTAEQPDWKRFELAVADFVSSIGAGEKITHDARIPDFHTKRARQRDVWVEWSVFGHFPAKALISCKYWRDSLDELDIDHFNGELQSSGAQIGIVYANSGFSGPALEKARTLQIHCCKLYENEPADVPQVLSFGLAYNFHTTFQIQVNGAVKAYSFNSWNQILDLPVGGKTIFLSLSEALDAYQDSSDPNRRWMRAKDGAVVRFRTQLDSKPPLEVKILIRDRKFRAKVEYTLLNGSYNITAGAFFGSQSTPWIDTQSVYPGPGWEEVDEIPETQPNPGVAAFMYSDSQKVLREYGRQPFPERPESA